MAPLAPLDPLDRTELVVDLRLIDVFASLEGVALTSLDEEALRSIVANVARACYSRGYSDGCDDEQARLLDYLFKSLHDGV